MGALLRSIIVRRAGRYQTFPQPRRYPQTPEPARRAPALSAPLLKYAETRCRLERYDCPGRLPGHRRPRSGLRRAHSGVRPAFGGRPGGPTAFRLRCHAPAPRRGWTGTIPGPSHSDYRDPVARTPYPSRVLRGFDPPEHNWLPGHRGVDLAAAVGAQVFAAGPGIVAFAGTVAGTPTVSIDHPDGIRTTYQPVTASVGAGKEVTTGQAIGVLARGHRDPGLHWGARPQGFTDRYLNPLELLAAPAIRLKPVDEPARRPF